MNDHTHDVVYNASPMLMTDALSDVLTERHQQRDSFSEIADDDLAPAEWIARVAKHVGRAVTQDPASFRREMVVVGALALAAIESFDRRYPQ